MNTLLDGYSTERRNASERVARIASVLRIGTGTLMVMAVLLLAMFIAGLAWVPTASSGSNIFTQLFLTEDFELDWGGVYQNGGLTLGSKFVLFAYATLLALWFLYCVSRVHSLFGNFKNEKVFVRQNIKLLRELGYALIVAFVFVWVIYILALFLAGTLPSEQEYWGLARIKFSFTDGITMKLLTIGSVFLAAWVMEIGCDLYDDNEYTI